MANKVNQLTDRERMSKLTDREREILAAWPKWPTGEYVWFGDRYRTRSPYSTTERDVVELIDFDSTGGLIVAGVDAETSWASLFTPIPRDSWEAIALDAHDGMTADALAERCRAMVAREREDG